jgi:Fe-S-cluster containining protein
MEERGAEATADRPFSRTACDCEGCSAHCREQPGPLGPGDVERLAAHLGRPVSAVLPLLWASPGAVVTNTTTGEVFRVATITPRLGERGCVFLAEDGACTVHPAAPFGCAMFDCHMTETEAQRRGAWLYAAIAADKVYAWWMSMLRPARTWRPR